ncbi:3'-5' exoribonuclease YhaM [bioreactor metagenome]|uniref:3'-5' exoribonuclease YhaM n=1 Tax=bioreactor metagenome TaxID=1076179 RepID=A0A645JCV4_9ZZZZ
MLHDVGKIFEISDFPINDYTDDGELIGHIVMGAEIVEEASKNIEGFPKKLLSLMKHSILAHHGEYEYGSPKLPKTIEAFLLHCADEMDAKTKIYEDVIETSDITGAWLGYQKFLQRNIRRSDY